jgi:hypothetical protein
MVIFLGKKSIFDHFIWKKKKNIQQIITLLKNISPNGKNSTHKKRKEKNRSLGDIKLGNEGFFFFPLNFLI